MRTLQSVDYSYYIRGLKSINLDANNNLTNKLFSMKLGYEETGYYDGNIGKQEWKSSLDGLTRAYTYNYDGANRILSGTYTGGKPNENYSLNSVVYDGNGNITNLSRNGFKSNNTFGLVDNLNYSYPNGSNKIQAVTDISGETASFTDVAGSTDYTYSADGSLISDANKGITIEYNYLKLPKKIVKGGTVILNQYDASGKKLNETIGANITDYVGNLIYKNNVLYQIGHDEGRVVDGQYEYFINDHLGNLRVSFRDSSGIAKISQKQDYDPYGAELQKISYLKNTWKESDFKYSGKEFIEQTGLNDFGWRQQDPILGRMWGVDYRAEKYYSQTPSHFALNNPMRVIEVNGDTVKIDPKATGQFKKDYAKARAYLKEKGQDAEVNQLENSTSVYIVNETDDTNGYFIPNRDKDGNFTSGGTISWNPTTGEEGENGTKISPTTVLNHEFDHASGYDSDPKAMIGRVRSKDPDYSNAEEKRVITGSEQRTARGLGEINSNQLTRESHGFKNPLLSMDPTSNQGTPTQRSYNLKEIKVIAPKKKKN